MSSRKAPVVLFAYKRPIHTQRVVDALLANPETQDTDLIVFVDGPKTLKEQKMIDDVCRIFESLNGFSSIDVRCSPTNLGLSRSIIQGVTSVFDQYDRIIVLEDDILVSKNFLEYMNLALDLYKSEETIASIHGYVYPIERELPQTFFIRGADCWGWATWRRAWEKFNPDGRALLQQLESSGQTSDFDFNGSAQFTDMLRGQIAGTNDSWAVRWYASAFLENMLTLYPGKSLVKNIGLDGSGTHSGKSEQLDTSVADSKESLAMSPLVIIESSFGREAFEDFFRSLDVAPYGSIIRRFPKRVVRTASRLMHPNGRNSAPCQIRKLKERLMR